MYADDGVANMTQGVASAFHGETRYHGGYPRTSETCNWYICTTILILYISLCDLIFCISKLRVCMLPVKGPEIPLQHLPPDPARLDP